PEPAAEGQREGEVAVRQRGPCVRAGLTSVACLATETGPDRHDLLTAKIDARDSVPNGQRHPVRTEPVARGHRSERDLGASLPSDHHDLVPDARIGHRAEVHARVLERRSAQDGNRTTTNEDSAVMEQPEAVARAERDDPKSHRVWDGEWRLG